MKFVYFEPPPDLRPLISSYYLVEMPCAWQDILRAEIANVRFILAGSVTSRWGDKVEHAHSPSALLCGPTSVARQLEFAPGTIVFGASVTPKGWRRCIGVSADECADQFLDLESLCGRFARHALRQLVEAPDQQFFVPIIDQLFRALANEQRVVREDFMGAASQWLTRPPIGHVDMLLEDTSISVRQVERLCRQVFGAPPKRLQRKFRALHASNYLAWSGDKDWHHAAGDSYYDQSHFIKNFKEFIGATPSAFVEGQNILIRQTLMQRLSINHASPFSLIG